LAKKSSRTIPWNFAAAVIGSLILILSQFIGIKLVGTIGLVVLVVGLIGLITTNIGHRSSPK
jgi:hypothetical protein